MFKIIDFQHIGGKIRIVIETDDQSSALFFRFFSEIQKFIDLYYFFLRSASQLELYQKNKPARMEQVYAAQAKQLEQYRELSGTRMEKLRILKEMRNVMGENVTLDRINAEISSALKRERNNNMLIINKLHEDGYSLHEISTKLAINKSTVSRYLKKGIPESPKEVSPLPSRVLPLRKRKT